MRLFFFLWINPSSSTCCIRSKSCFSWIPIFSRISIFWCVDSWNCPSSWVCLRLRNTRSSNKKHFSHCWWSYQWVTMFFPFVKKDSLELRISSYFLLILAFTSQSCSKPEQPPSTQLLLQLSSTPKTKVEERRPSADGLAGRITWWLCSLSEISLLSEWLSSMLWSKQQRHSPLSILTSIQWIRSYSRSTPSQ